jgi:antitoxin PrlF
MRIHMYQKKPARENDTSRDPSCGCSSPQGCRVEAVLSVDDRGQMVLPKDVREKAGIKSGDKLALISWEKNGTVCCLALMKVENLSGMVKEVLGPLMNVQD